MDPFASSSSAEDWWAEVDLPETPDSSQVCLEGQSPLPALPLLPATPSESTVPSSRTTPKKKGHIRMGPKDQHLRGKDSPNDLFPVNEETAWNDLLQDMYLNEMTLSPSISPSDASTVPPNGSFIFKTSKERDPCVQSILTCADQGDLDMCTTDEKRRIADELKARLKSIEGGIASLKASLKKLIKDKI